MSRGKETPHELDANITLQAGIEDALSKTTIRKSGRKGGALNMSASEKSWRRGMPNVWHYIIFYPVGLLEEMPTSHKQLTKSHPPWLVEPLLL